MAKSIYQYDINEIRKLLKEFSNTVYGRTVFFLAYFAPMMTFLVMIGLVISAIVTRNDAFFLPILGTFLLFVAIFILGNIYYYCELRIYSEKRDK